MAKKKYIAKTDVSVSVLLPSGKSLHVSFASLSNGGSVYYTTSEEVQTALENHYRYGKLFKEDKSFDENAVPKGKTVMPITGASEGPKKIKVNDPDEAKGYLSEQFGVSRTKMKSIKAIKDEAMAHNIEFEGL